MEELKSLVRQSRVFDWLRAQFPWQAEEELLSAVDGDSERVIRELEKKGPRG